MSNELPQTPVEPSLPDTLRQIAAEQSDPRERESLLRSADRIEATEKKLYAELASMREDARRIAAEANAVTRRRGELPTWVVFAALLGFMLMLTFIALKHHV